MAMVSRTRDMLEGLVKESSFKWFAKRKGAFDREIEEMEGSPSAAQSWMPELSPPANVIVRRCSKFVFCSTFAIWIICINSWRLDFCLPKGEIHYVFKNWTWLSVNKLNWCRILGIPVCKLRENFDLESPDHLKHKSSFALNFLEYCCFMALARSTEVIGYLEDNKFRRLTFDMMVVWDLTNSGEQAPHVCFFYSTSMKYMAIAIFHRVWSLALSKTC